MTGQFDSNRDSAVKVSIGLPVYNGASLLPHALDSLLGQTFSDFELIISDNASTDQTEAVCQSYAARDRRIRYVRQPVNRGAIWNFNEVFRLSRSEYFKWASHDDVCHPTFLARCVEVLDNQPEIAWCHSRSRHIDGEGDLLFGEETPKISYVASDAENREGGDSLGDLPTRASARASDRFRSVLLGRDGCLDSYGLIRSSVIRKTPLYLPYFGAEKVFVAELTLWGRYYEIPETLFLARIHAKAAGALRDEQAQRRFMAPLSATRRQSARLRLLAGYLAAVRRSELKWIERARCYSAIARYLLQINKWRNVIAAALTGGGLRGAYPSVDSTRDSKVPEDTSERPAPTGNVAQARATAMSRSRFK